MRQILPDNPKQIVFSGGGLRCFWQGGFMQELEKTRHYKPERITGVSGGALAGAAWLGGIEDRLLQVMCARFEEQDSNLFDREYHEHTTLGLSGQEIAATGRNITVTLSGSF